MITLNLKTLKLKALTKQLISHAKKIESQRKKLFLRLAVLGFKDIQQHFRDEKGPSGGWKALSAITLKNRRKGKKKGFKILQDRANLKNSLMPNVGQKKLTRDSVILSIGGTKRGKVITYAARHNFGLKGMPRREFMWISKDARGKMTEQIRKFTKFV